MALFICDKLFVANAGDSRAGLFLSRLEKSGLRQMSTDFNPSNDRQRIQHVAFHRPELLRHPQTKEKLFNRHLLSRKVERKDIGVSVMYRDYYMTGWSCKDVTDDDVKLIPIITGENNETKRLALNYYTMYCTVRKYGGTARTKVVCQCVKNKNGHLNWMQRTNKKRVSSPSQSHPRFPTPPPPSMQLSVRWKEKCFFHPDILMEKRGEGEGGEKQRDS